MFQIVQPYDNLVLAWLALALASAAWVGWDQFRNNPEPSVMRWGFVLVTLYMGPFGLLLYVLADKEPRPGAHEVFTSPLWKQGVGSTIHCVAGDATGIILAAVITASLGLPMWQDLIVEYIAGFAFGLLIFQSLFMQAMMGGTYVENVRRSFMPEFISMNAMMAGMAPMMTLLMMGRDMRAMAPTEPLFWAVMSVGVTAGFALAYPFNVWLVMQGMKHGLMTVRPKGSKFDLAAAGETSARPDQHAPHGQHAGGHAEHEGHEGGGHSTQAKATTPQLAALAGVTGLMLVAGIAGPASVVNLGLSAREVGGLIMPPGMIMVHDTAAESMRDMAAVERRQVAFRAAKDARGDTLLTPVRIEAGGTKVFQITASVIQWNILGGVAVDAYAYNEQIPGPRLALVQGDKVRIEFHNELPEPSTMHWHGLIVPNEMDGPAQITQDPVPPGGRYDYSFTVEQSGTYFYHSHDHPDRQQGLGLYGAIIVSPRDAAQEVKADQEYTIQLQEWLYRGGLTYPAMPMEGALANYFTINGKAYPETDTVHMRVGQTVKLRFIGTNNSFVHPMHVHGGPFEMVARDGETLQSGARFLADTVNVGPGQRYDLIWTARRPGKWLVHCHIPHHTANDNVEVQGGGGLMMILDVTG